MFFGVFGVAEFDINFVKQGMLLQLFQHYVNFLDSHICFIPDIKVILIILIENFITI